MLNHHGLGRMFLECRVSVSSHNFAFVVGMTESHDAFLWALFVDVLVNICPTPIRTLPGEMDETDAFRIKRLADDTVSLAPSTTESIIVEGGSRDQGFP